MNLVLVAAIAVLAAEIVIMAMFLRKKSSFNDERLSVHNAKSEFDFI